MQKSTKEVKEKIKSIAQSTIFNCVVYIGATGKMTDKLKAEFYLEDIEDLVSQTRQEVIEELDDIIELWFAVHDKTTKSFMTDDFRKFVADKLHSQTKEDRRIGTPNTSGRYK